MSLSASTIPAFPRVLSVDDDPDVCTMIRATFSGFGIETWSAGDASAALGKIRQLGIPDLMLLDVRLPGPSGVELAEQLHGFCDVPIVFLTAVDDEPTIVDSLDRWADDWIIKPFRPYELAARVRRVLRRSGTLARSADSWVPVATGLEVDFAAKCARCGGREVPLTPTEAKILHILSKNTGRAVRSQYLVSRIWPDEDIFEESLRVHMYRLRRKIESDPNQPRWLHTARGIGYGLSLA